MVTSKQGVCQMAKPINSSVKIESPTNKTSAKALDTFFCGRVIVPAKFPGGDEGWDNYLAKNLNKQIPAINGAPTGTYQVIILFVIGRDGNINQIRPATSFGYGMEKEAIRIIERSPKWIPSNLNGRLVNEYRKQTVTFIVSESLPTITIRNI